MEQSIYSFSASTEKARTLKKPLFLSVSGKHLPDKMVRQSYAQQARE